MKLSWFTRIRLTNVFRFTPILAIALMPVALYFLVTLRGDDLALLYRPAWSSGAVLKLRLAIDEPAIRIAAVKDAGTWSPEDATLLGKLVASLKSDESRPVRNAAAIALGRLGSRVALPTEATQALSNLVLYEQDDSLLSAAIAAVGQSAIKNRYPYAVIERIAKISTEEHFAWVYPQSAKALGQIGAAQPLPGPLFALMNAWFNQPRHDGEREYVANAFVEIAKYRSLPVNTLHMLTRAFAHEPNVKTRKSILYALAHSASHYSYAMTLITAAITDANKEIVAAAEQALRIVESNRNLENNDPLSVAMNKSEPVETRLSALQMMRGARIDPAVYTQIVALAGDPETKIAAAAVEMFHWLASSAENEFDKRILVPALSRAMADSDPIVRFAAYGELSTISRNQPDYLQAGDIAAQLEIAANDPDPRVRVVVLVMMQRVDEQREAVIERGLMDPDPYVRSNAVRWLDAAGLQTDHRKTLLAAALEDPSPDVRRSAEAARQGWRAVEPVWLVELRQGWQAGEHGRVRTTILMALTMAAPVLIGARFLLYYIARLLSCLQRRQWRAAAAIPVVGVWTAASYGMFLLFLAAGKSGDLDTVGFVDLAIVLWWAIAAYTVLGWSMHCAMRR